MKICMLTTSYPRSDKDWCVPFINSLAKELAKTDNEIIVVSSDSTNTKLFEIRNKVKIYRFRYFFPKQLQKLTYHGGMLESFRSDFITTIQAPFFMISFILKALKIGRKCDVIHAHWVPSGLAGLFVKMIYKKPVLMTVWGADVRSLPKFISRFVLKRVDLVNSFQPELTDIIKSLGRKKGLVNIPSMMDYEKFNSKADTAAFKKEFWLRDEKIITFIGRLEEMKDPLTFVNALPLLLKRRKDVKFLLIGGGHLENAARERAKQLGVENNLVITGPRSDTNIILKCTDIFVAISPLENVFSTTIIEAMYSRVPCILSKAGYTENVFRHKHDAYLIPFKNPTALANAIVSLLDDQKLLETLIQNGRQFIEENGFTREHIVKKHIETYEKLIKLSRR